MSKITLLRAKEILESITLIDVFASLVSNTLLEDKVILQTQLNLTNKIYQAENHFCINDIKNQVNLLRLKQEYYHPANILFYYKDDITQEVKDSNKDIYNEITINIDLLESKIKDMSKDIYIEAD